VHCANIRIRLNLADFRSILDSYSHAPDEISEDNNDESEESEETGEEIISLDSDDDEENIPLKSQDVTIWYSSFLKTLERQYPNAFDDVVRDVMRRVPGRKRNGLKNVLGMMRNFLSPARRQISNFSLYYRRIPTESLMRQQRLQRLREPLPSQLKHP
jgi:hypothetical protein